MRYKTTPRGNQDVGAGFRRCSSKTKSSSVLFQQSEWWWCGGRWTCSGPWTQHGMLAMLPVPTVPTFISFCPRRHTFTFAPLTTIFAILALFKRPLYSPSSGASARLPLVRSSQQLFKTSLLVAAATEEEWRYWRPSVSFFIQLDYTFFAICVSVCFVQPTSFFF